MVLPHADRSDDELIAAIAEHRDAEAFTALFKRYEHAAFALALHITGQRDLAEEAMQETALRLWLSARLYRTGSVAHSWLLGIVAGKSLEVLRARRRRGQASVPEAVSILEPESESIRPEEHVEKNEGLTALRQALAGLPRLERQLLALHFGGGLSHEEIGTAMAMPRRTISYKLEQAVKALRAQLVQAGFGALAPLLGAEGLHQALTSGAQAPAGLCERVSAGLTKAARESLRGGQLASAKGTWSPRLLLPAGLALAAAGAVVFWWAAGFKPVVPKTDAQVSSGPQQVLPAPPAQAAPKNEPFLRHWDFNTPEQAQAFKVLEGSWHYVPNGGPDGSGCMETDGAPFSALLEIPALKLPVRAEFKCEIFLPQPKPHYHASFSPSRYLRAAVMHNAGILDSVRAGEWVPHIKYLAPGYIDCWQKGRRTQLTFYAGWSGLHLYLRGKHRMDELTLTGIREDELPDLRVYQSAIEKIEPSRRVGTVLLPDLKSMRPPEPAAVTFYGPSDGEQSQRSDAGN